MTPHRKSEEPPALIGPTFGLSLWVWLLTWSVGYLYPVLFPPTSGIQTAWTTVVLAVPALLTGWLLSRLTAETVRFMSASAFALIVWLSINVAAVVTVCALTMSGASMIEWDALPGTLDMVHPEWVFLLASTAAHLCASALLFVGRGLRYSRTVKEGASR
ncbi:MAG: hypothetical protein NT132_02945 [Microbacterium sp.]|uniref:hypothetical protein n=1 Tax=Microbacterium sp. TaxID=51671 RepID=UPI0026074BBF|nr:hypothetical protein [Microbacterium sp.]MCX6501355.1 hypothetical protein [Microbacterium sp.]